MGRAGVPMTGGQGSMSKLKGGDVAMWATTECMDIVGPYAQSTDCPLEKWFRDAKIYQLFEGTAEIQRMVVSRMQVAEYRKLLGENLEAAATAARSGAAATTNGANGNGASATDGTAKAAAATTNGAGAGERETAEAH